MIKYPNNIVSEMKMLILSLGIFYFSDAKF